MTGLSRGVEEPDDETLKDEVEAAAGAPPGITGTMPLGYGSKAGLWRIFIFGIDLC